MNLVYIKTDCIQYNITFMSCTKIDVPLLRGPDKHTDNNIVISLTHTLSRRQ